MRQSSTSCWSWRESPFLDALSLVPLRYRLRPGSIDSRAPSAMASSMEIRRLTSPTLIPTSVRMSGTMNEEQHGDEGSQEHAPQDPEEEHAGKGGHGDREFRPAERPHAPQLGPVDEARDGHEHDRGQDDLGEGAQEAREKQKA